MGPKEKAIRKSEATRARILEAALSLFRKRGFENATMRDIAKEAGVALGAAYYYFHSKEALVMAFYERTQIELSPRLEEALAKTHGLEERLRAMLEIKLAYFAPNRKLMGALSAHIDPQHPLSPFSEATRAIREQDIQLFERALQDSKTRVPEDLRIHLPRLLWLYQMGLLLFWIYDRSPQQKRTTLLFSKTLSIVVKLIQFSGFPLLRPVRKLVTDLLAIIYGEGELTVAEETL
jgi:AcrR family transcriptional regulator